MFLKKKKIDEQSAGNLKVSEKAKLLIYAILDFLSLGYTCKLEITPVTGVHVGVKIDTYPYLQSCAQKKIILH